MPPMLRFQRVSAVNVLEVRSNVHYYVWAEAGHFSGLPAVSGAAIVATNVMTANEIR